MDTLSLPEGQTCWMPYVPKYASIGKISLQFFYPIVIQAAAQARLSFKHAKKSLRFHVIDTLPLD